MIYPENSKIYAWFSADKDVEAAKEFISEMGWTGENIKLRRNLDCVYLETVTEVEIPDGAF